jgi:hypothetical protein
MTLKSWRGKSPFLIQEYQKENKSSKEISLFQANQVIESVKCFTGALAFELTNSNSDLSASATIVLEVSVSGHSWVQAVDSDGVDFSYTMGAGATIIDTISGIPIGTFLRFKVVENLTGILEIFTKI